jgi:hypothetical protein
VYSTRTHGSLAVVEQTIDRKRIERELRALDPALFLDPEIDLQGRFVWTVKEHIGSAVPPHLVFEWRDPQSKDPLPLTWGILDRVRRSEKGRGTTWVGEINKANDARRERLRQDADAVYQEITDDVTPRMRDTRSAVLPRGVGLRMARDKRRAKGEKV